MRVVAWCGRAFIASGGSFALRANSSAVMRCGVDMPSPMKRMMFFGLVDAKRELAAKTPTDSNSRNLSFMDKIIPHRKPFVV